MPVISAAIAAITVATVVTTAATVASAVVAVSVAIGTMGLAVSAIGMITKNKGLLKAGKIMGYIGLAGGLAGGAIGGLGNVASGAGTFAEGAAQAYAGAQAELAHAWDTGIGSWFSGGTANSVTGAVPGTAPVTTASPAAPGYTVPSVNQAVDSSIANAGTALKAGAGVLDDSPGILQSIAPTINPPAAPTGGLGATVNAPQAPTGSVPTLGASGPNSGMPPPMSQPPPAVGGVTSATLKAKDWWDTLPDYMKMSLMTTGGQGIAGLASGYFQGASAEERLEMEKLINQQAQNQLQYQNRNAAYAPVLNFNRQPASNGLLNTAGGT